MAESNNQKLAEKNIPGMNRHERFGQVEHAENVGKTLRQVAVYFVHEKRMVLGMLAVVICGTLCGVSAPGLQSKAVDIIAGERTGDTHSHGDVMSRMTNDIENISTTVSLALPSLFSGVLTIIGTVSVMVWYCWQLALLSFATVFLTFAATKILSGRVRSASLPCWRRTMKTRQAKR